MNAEHPWHDECACRSTGCPAPRTIAPTPEEGTMTERAEQFEHQHTLGEATDPKEVNHPDAYQRTDDDKALIDPMKVVLVQAMRSCLITGPEGELGIAFQLQGRTGGPEGTEVAVTQVISLEGLGKMVGQLIELAISSGEASAKAFNEAMSDEMVNQVENHQAFVQSRQEQP